MIANLLQAVCLLPLLAVHTGDTLWIVYLVAVVESALAQFVAPAEQALLPRLVGEEQLVAANALAALNANIARLVGAPLGGVVAGLLGLNGTVLLDAASFAISGTLIAGIAAARGRSEEPLATIDATGGARWAAAWREWIAGLRAVRRERTVSTLFMLVAAQSVAQGLFVVLFVVFVSTALHGGATEIGWLRGVQALGGLIGGVAVGTLGQRLPVARLIGLSAILFGAIDLAIWNAPMVVPAYALAVAVVLFIAVGMPGAGVQAGAMTLVQQGTDDAYRGRVFGAFGTSAALAQLGGMALAGALGDRLGALPLLNLQASLYVLVGVLALALLPKGVSQTLPDRGACAAPARSAQEEGL